MTTTPAETLRAALDRLDSIHQPDGGACGTCADADGQAAAWPCETASALAVARQVLGTVTAPPETEAAPPVDRGAILREAADAADTVAAGLRGDCAVGAYAVMQNLYRMADEAQQPTDRATEEAVAEADPVGLCAACGDPREGHHHGYEHTPGYDDEQQPAPAVTEEATAARPVSPIDEVRAWNEQHPVGTPVRVWTGAREGDGTQTRTRFRASVLGDHTAVVWVDGEGSCISLSHVDPAP
ncbi:hypothetical protein ACFWMX_14775 [Streptomyces sp. NPDC058378]|uniref:hypothetical protein n=1 Tax=Streptomyces sp. NPDC058378 TaxID=3346469 RepID=UPI00366904E2